MTEGDPRRRGHCRALKSEPMKVGPTSTTRGKNPSSRTVITLRSMINSGRDTPKVENRKAIAVIFHGS
jgi:hypothetical protein